MSEVLSRIDVAAEVASQRAAIINGVLRDGVKSAKRLKEEGKPYFGSFDKSPRELISFRLLLPLDRYESPENLNATLNDVLYLRGISVLPVMAERQDRDSDVIDEAYSSYFSYGKPYQMNDQVVKILERRASSSFILVISESMDELMRKMRGYPLGSISSAIEEVGSSRENRISPDKFSHLLFPEDIWNQYQAKRRNIDNAEIKIVKRKIERNLFTRNIPLKVPDYEGVLLEILKEHKQALWIHGVRLPNEEDVWH